MTPGLRQPPDVAESLAALVRDPEAGQAALDALLAPLPDATGETATPAEGWTVRDRIAHLTFFDETGTPWRDGDPAAADRVTGSAIDFGLVVTRRRHVAETDRAVEGPVATEWMRVAQAFAGPPGSGRRPGQIPRR